MQRRRDHDEPVVGLEVHAVDELADDGHVVGDCEPEVLPAAPGFRGERGRQVAVLGLPGGECAVAAVARVDIDDDL